MTETYTSKHFLSSPFFRPLPKWRKQCHPRKSWFVVKLGHKVENDLLLFCQLPSISHHSWVKSKLRALSDILALPLLQSLPYHGILKFACWAGNRTWVDYFKWSLLLLHNTHTLYHNTACTGALWTTCQILERSQTHWPQERIHLLFDRS